MDKIVTASKLKILLLTGMYPSAEMPRNGLAVQKQVESLQKLGVEFGVFHLREPGHGSLFTSVRQLRKEVARGKYDLVHLHYGAKSSFLALFSPVPVIATYHGTDINGWVWSRREPLLRTATYNAAAMFVRMLARRFDAVIVMSEEMKRRLSAKAARKTRVIPMGIDTSAFVPTSRERARQELGWGDEQVVVFANNGNEIVKRQDLAEAAMKILHGDRPDVRFFVLRGISHSEMPLVLSAADCLLITSDKEGAPNILREAMACGLPVISVPVGDVPEVMNRYPHTGVIVPRNPKDIAEGLAGVLSEPTRTTDEAVLEEISIHSTAKKVLDVYRSVMDGGNTVPV